MKTNIVKSISGVVNKSLFSIKKHSPEILVGVGVVGSVASTVLACKATTKVSTILEETKTQVDQIHYVLESNDIDESRYSQEDAKKDLTIVYAQSAIKFIKLYAPSVLLGAASITCILKSHNILRKRNIALAAAYTAVDKGFKEYRERVVDRFGAAVDRELRYNTKAQKITEIEVDEETGKEKKVKRTIEIADSASVYARFFEQYISTKDPKTGEVTRSRNYCWEPNNEHNMVFLNAQQSYANDMLRAKGYLFLNDVYKMLGLPESIAGQEVGWVYDKNREDANGDGYISFGIYSQGSDNFSDFIYGSDEAILLDFNVDGPILEKTGLRKF